MHPELQVRDAGGVLRVADLQRLVVVFLQGGQVLGLDRRGLLGQLLGAGEQDLEMVGGGLADRVAGGDGLGLRQPGDVAVLPQLGQLGRDPGADRVCQLRDRQGGLAGAGRRDRREPWWASSLLAVSVQVAGVRDGLGGVGAELAVGVVGQAADDRQQRVPQVYGVRTGADAVKRWKGLRSAVQSGGKVRSGGGRVGRSARC